MRLLVAFAVFAAVATVGIVKSSPTVSYTVNIHDDKSDPIPSDFASFSLEVPCLPKMITYEDPTTGVRSPRQSYINIIDQLRLAAKGARGPNIRIGGNSADQTIFSVLPNTSIPTGDNNVVTLDDILSYGLVKKWNGTIVIGINLRNGRDPRNSVEYATSALTLLDPELIEAFEIGNEPDLFSNNGIRPEHPIYDYNRYLPQFIRYVDALREQSVPMPRIQGATVATEAWNNQLLNYTVNFTTPGPIGSYTQNVLRTVSHHFYPMPSATATIKQLLDHQSAYNPAWLFKDLAKASKDRGIPFVIGEGNSAFDGGRYGVSNTFASTIWGIDVMFWSASADIKRWNFHGCPDGAYTPLATQGTPYVDARPLFYGMWAFSHAIAAGSRLVDLKVANAGEETHDVVAWATRTDSWPNATEGNHRLCLTVLLSTTNSTYDAIDVSFALGSELASKAANIRVLAPQSRMLNATDGIYFGGLTFDNTTTGLPSGTPDVQTKMVDSSGKLDLTIEFSAILVVDIFW